jgi:hypothetical protein
MNKNDKLIIHGFAFLLMGTALATLLGSVVQFVLRPKLMMSYSEIWPFNIYLPMYIPCVIELATTTWAGILFLRARHQNNTLLSNIGLLMCISGAIIVLANVFNIYSTQTLSVDATSKTQEMFKQTNP